MPRYTDEQFVDPTTTEITDGNALAECASWSYADKDGVTTTYDLYATHLKDGKYYYDAACSEYAEGGASIATDGHTYYGNVFGGGSGVIPYAPGKWHRAAGSVGGDTYVNITGGHILTSVYGGNEQTDVGGYSKDATGAPTVPETGGRCVINMSGGTIGVPRTAAQIQAHPVIGNLFGAGKGDQRIFFNTWTNVRSTEVNILGNARIYGSTFGGGEDGHVIDNAVTNISGNAVIGTTGTSNHDGDVFGGGRGSVTALTAGVVGGNVDLNVNGGTILGSVYGGGRLASVGTFFALATDANYGRMQTGDNHGIINVDLKGGTIGQNVFGGCMGSMANDALGVSKNVIVKLNEDVADDAKGCVVKGNMFGCNNLNSSPLGSVLVHVFKTQNAAADRITNPAEGDQMAKVKGRYDIAAVYGGGNLAAYKPQGANVTSTDYDYKNTTHYAEVIIDGCEGSSIQQVYGGGNAASTPATKVTVNGSYEIEEVFGGGNGKDDYVLNGETKKNPGANVGFYDYSAVENEDWCNTKEKRSDPKNTKFVPYIYGTGKAEVNIFGGTIHRVFGGSNTKGNVRQSTITLLEEAGGCTFCVDEAYGGGKSAPMDAEAKLLMACIPGLKEVYGGAEAADVYDDVTVTVTNGTFDRVFGGNNLSGTIRGKITVNVEETGCRPVIIGELYGGGNQAAYSVKGYDSDGKPKETGENIYQNPEVNVRSFTSIGNIYGGGYGAGAVMVGNPTVNINVVEGDKKDYTYDNDKSAYKNANNEDVPYYDTEGFKELTLTVDGHEVTLPSHTKGKIGAINNVFGGGNAAKVIGNTNVNVGTETTQTYVSVDDNPATETKENVKEVKGADIRGNVYGGGNNAEVTGNTNVQIGKKTE